MCFQPEEGFHFGIEVLLLESGEGLPEGEVHFEVGGVELGEEEDGLQVDAFLLHLALPKSARAYDIPIS